MTLKDPPSAADGQGMAALSHDPDLPAEAARLRARVAELETVIDASADALIMIDGDGIVRVWNPAAERITGLPAAAALGRSLRELDSATFDTVRARLEAAMRDTGRARVLAQVPPAGGGEPVTVSVTMSALFGRHGAGAVLTARDVPAESLRDAQRSAFWELSGDMLVIADAGGRWMIANPAFTAATGYAQRDLLAHAYLDAEDRARIAQLLKATAPGEAVRFQSRLLCRDGSERLVLWSARMHEDRTVYAVGADITDRERQARVLAEQAEALTRSNQDLELFASAASHDLQEPLRMIELCAAALAANSGELPADAAELARTIATDAQRAAAQVDGLLRLARANTDRAAWVTVNAGELAQRAASALRAQIADHGVALTVERLPAVRGDICQLTNVMQNLLANAIKFRDPETPLRVHVRPGPGGAIEVLDNGVGVPAGQEERIFEVFRRGQDNRDGLGIGLALCRRIVEQHGGQITAARRRGAGSVFTLRLPTVEP